MGMPTLQPPPPSQPGPPNGAFHQPGSGGRHRKKDHGQGQGGRSTKKTTGHGQKRPRGRHRHGFTDLGTSQQATPSLPASCLLTQEAITRSNVKMKHVPALTDPGLAMLHLAGR
ncbi:uncharacterized protein LOC111558761 [Felis catus]|uniref:uncharacterized protein LOC111558761 n=1 Tax=Felis catus TaxID=9685 RepID=UPI000C2F86A9|nr:uncharacterized protein LOC111558761 [Felis catus]